MFLINSRLWSVAAGHPLPRATRPYPEVTATDLPSSLTKVLSYTLAHYAPTHLCWFGVRVHHTLTLAAFLGSMSFPLACLAADLRLHPSLMTSGFTYQSPRCTRRHSHRTQEISRSVPASVCDRVQEY